VTVPGPSKVAAIVNEALAEPLIKSARAFDFTVAEP
jgi:hypothetical protein